MEYKTDLLLMGYRPLGTNEHGVTVSAKHFGYTLLVIAIKGDDLTLAQHFKGNEDKPLVWNTFRYNPIEDGSVIQWIRYVECFDVKTGTDTEAQAVMNMPFSPGSSN